MKKILVLFLSMLFMTGTVYGFDTFDGSISVETTLRGINATVYLSQNIAPTVKILNCKTNNVFYTTQIDDEPNCEVLYRTNASGTTDAYRVFSYTFFVPFGVYAQTANYKLCVNDKLQTDFIYVSPADKIKFLNAIHDARASEIETILTEAQNNGILDENVYAFYFHADAETKAKINQSLDALALSDLSSDATDEAIAVEEEKWQTEIKRLTEVVTLLSAKDGAALAQSLNSTEQLLVNTKFYRDIYADAICLFLAKNLPADFSQKTVSDMFCTACLYAVFSQAGRDTISDTLFEAVADGTLSTKTNHSKAQMQTIASHMKEKADDIHDLSKIQSIFNEAESLLNQESSSYGSASSSGSSNKKGTVSGLVSDRQEIKNETKSSFQDVPPAHWAYNSVEQLKKIGAVSGFPDGYYHPDDYVTREELAKIVVLAFSLSSDSEQAPTFSDVSRERWSSSYVAALAEKKAIFGVGNDLFMPTANLTRQDMTVVLYRLYNKKVEITTEALQYKDANAISDYAKEAVEQLTSAGIVSGNTDGTFAPHNLVTRAQAANAVYALYKKTGGAL